MSYTAHFSHLTFLHLSADPQHKTLKLTPIQKALSWYSLGVELLKNSRPKLQGSCQVSRKIFCYDLLDIRRKLENNQSAFMRDQALKYFSFIPLMWGKCSKSIQNCGMASSVANKQASGTKYRNVELIPDSEIFFIRNKKNLEKTLIRFLRFHHE